MDSKILNFYAFNSARYEVLKDKWRDVNLEIYYHKGHEYNLDRMMKGMKAALEYCSENFSPYQHKQARIIEFQELQEHLHSHFQTQFLFRKLSDLLQMLMIPKRVVMITLFM